MLYMIRYMGECCAIKNFVHHEDRKKAKTMKTNYNHQCETQRQVRATLTCSPLSFPSIFATRITFFLATTDDTQKMQE